MPVGIQRLNAKKSQPNDRIAFIKPLKGKDEAIAQDFLERIAAQCLPIMREHHLSVTTLEEHEPNREFVGRNFNGGEVIQLVLRAHGGGRPGAWLPFGCVQMVMMHELAHCAHMNHSRAFWAVRHRYADQLRALRARGYTGEGLWGRGALLATGAFSGAVAVAGGEELPEHLCGGAYRSRLSGHRKRRRRGGAGGGKEDLSYQERKQRRIEKKFGRNGVALGADDDVKARLEKGKRTQATPRVAGSNRGRDLRAAAALARFEQQKQEVKEEEEEEDEETDEESEYDDAEDADPGVDDAVDIDGKKLLDAKGNSMVKVCEDEGPAGEDAANELEELRSSITRYFAPSKDKSGEGSSSTRSTVEADAASARQSPRKTVSRNSSTDAVEDRRTTTSTDRQPGSIRKDETQSHGPGGLTSSTGAASSKTASTSNNVLRPESKGTTCAVCSFENEAYTVTCSMCSHVLRAADVPGTWKCQSASCRDSGYLNAGDCGACGVCGQRKGGGGVR